MENTNQKNTGNIQIAPVSAASDLNHKREGYLTWDEYFMELPCFPACAPRIPIHR